MSQNIIQLYADDEGMTAGMFFGDCKRITIHNCYDDSATKFKKDIALVAKKLGFRLGRWYSVEWGWWCTAR